MKGVMENPMQKKVKHEKRKCDDIGVYGLGLTRLKKNGNYYIDQGLGYKVSRRE